MKLYPVLFSEAAKTAEHAAGVGLAAFLIGGLADSGKFETDGRVTLVSVGRFMAGVKKACQYAVSQLDALTPETFRHTTKDSVVGDVSFDIIRGGANQPLFKVDTSAGVNKFGPLAYQIVMHLINLHGKTGWLRSDSSLTSGKGSSSSVWNGMYQNDGIYERRWLGDFFPGNPREASSMIRPLCGVSEKVSNDLYGYRATVDSSDPDTLTEGHFLQFLATNNLSPGNYGHMWAYRLKNNELAGVHELFEAGTTLYEDVAAILDQEGLKYKSSSYEDDAVEFTPGDLDHIVRSLGNRFFSRRYKTMDH